tara:strand:+ start:484 stop:603 length:120 start_codon:yes stop_codon:yes gene_type:complete
MASKVRSFSSLLFDKAYKSNDDIVAVLILVTLFAGVFFQ